ncbi:MAG: hypothetical protein K2N54_00085 [Helicobacter sp.]|nr:hypothetical protein [Helicobacter sp.]
MFRYAQHDNRRCGFNRTHYHFMCATKVAPPLYHSPSLAEGVGGGSLRASATSVAIKRLGIPTRLIASGKPSQ